MTEYNMRVMMAVVLFCVSIGTVSITYSLYEYVTYEPTLMERLNNVIKSF